MRSGLGSFFYTNRNNVYLTQSFSIGLKSLLNILKPNLKLLLIKNDYPSILEQVKSNGFEYNFVDSKRNLENSILKGIKKPHECPEFGKKCKPEFPLGAPMVSSEGACAAYYHFHQAMEDVL